MIDKANAMLNTSVIPAEWNFNQPECATKDCKYKGHLVDDLEHSHGNGGIHRNIGECHLNTGVKKRADNYNNHPDRLGQGNDDKAPKEQE